MFALVGTLISTMMVGLILYQLGQGGIVTRMSLEEALAFGALISAIDPVSTLAQFGSIKVPLSLGALVYGESVINDAVSIVLYRMFTGFLTEEVTTGAIAMALLTVVGMLFGSVRCHAACGMGVCVGVSRRRCACVPNATYRIQCTPPPSRC